MSKLILACLTLGFGGVGVWGCCPTEQSLELQHISSISKAVFDYPMDDVLHLQHLQMKGTHNSYHLESDTPMIHAWQYSHAPLPQQLSQQGVRQFELDIYHQPDTGRFNVLHVPVIDSKSSCKSLQECLHLLKSWSDEHLAHHPIFVLIEPKNTFNKLTAATYFRDLENEILSVWPRDRLITPEDVRGSYPTLSAAVKAGAWPTLGQARGKALFSLLNFGDYRSAYTYGDTSLDNRLMFVSAPVDAPYAAIVLIDNPIERAHEIRTAVAAGFIVRTRADVGYKEAEANDKTRLLAALDCGAHLISTDYPAQVEGVNYWTDIPQGTPSRCNPLTAPAGCNPLALENPNLITYHAVNNSP